MSGYQNSRFSKKPFNRGGGDRFDGPKQMFKTNCSKCNDVCEVPFRPNGKKPVFCRNCFVKDDARPSYGPKREFSPRPSFNAVPPRDDRSLQELKAEMKGMNEKLSRLVALMEAAQAPAAPAKKAAKKTAKK